MEVERQQQRYVCNIDDEAMVKCYKRLQRLPYQRSQKKKTTENTYRVHRNTKEPREMSGKSKENEKKKE